MHCIVYYIVLTFFLNKFFDILYLSLIFFFFFLLINTIFVITRYALTLLHVVFKHSMKKVSWLITEYVHFVEQRATLRQYDVANVELYHLTISPI